MKDDIPLLDGVEGEHRPRSTRTLQWVSAASVPLALILVLEHATAGTWWLASLYGVVAALNALLLCALRLQRTRTRAEGLRVHSGTTWTPLIRWSEVAAVHVQGRWDRSSAVTTTAGRRIELLGVPAEVAQQLAAHVARVRAGAG